MNELVGSCVMFSGYRQRNGEGYGQLTYKGKRWLAHRFAWEQRHGPIPDGMLVCHRCNNKGCVNPDHLYLGTVSDNTRDAWRDGLTGNQNTRKTVCSRCGGPFSTNKHGRFCKPCKLASNRKTKKQRRIRAAIDSAREQKEGK